MISSIPNSTLHPLLASRGRNVTNGSGKPPRSITVGQWVSPGGLGVVVVVVADTVARTLLKYLVTLLRHTLVPHRRVICLPSRGSRNLVIHSSATTVVVRGKRGATRRALDRSPPYIVRIPCVRGDAVTARPLSGISWSAGTNGSSRVMTAHPCVCANYWNRSTPT